jgi:hypothetical protein
MKKTGMLLLVACGFLTPGCAFMSSYEQAKYRALKQDLARYGLPVREEKDPVVAATLNVLPGFGNAYLEQWGPFVGNLLFWPFSVAWGVPQAYRDTSTINEKDTLYFYEFGSGKDRLAAAQASRRPAPAPPSQP